MAFSVGPTTRSLRGYGVPIKDHAGVLIVFLEFAQRAEAEEAESAIKAGLLSALRIRNTRGEEWCAASAPAR